MKKLSLLLLLPIFLFSCSSDDNELDKVEPEQDYTSFVFTQDADVPFENCIAAYLDANKHYIKIEDKKDPTQYPQ